MIARRILPSEWEAFRDIRLESLRLHPEAFTADLDAEAALTPEQWRGRAGQCWFTCDVANGLGGTILFQRDEACAKTAHVGHLRAMYVRAAARGRGVGDALVAAVLAEARVQGAEQIHLGVHTQNRPAIALYERHGFVPYGTFAGALKVDGVYWDELLMMRPVSPAA